MLPLWEKFKVISTWQSGWRTEDIIMVIYRISINFHYDLIFTFFASAFTSQNIQYAETISGHVFFAIRNFLTCKKWLIQIKELHIFLNFVTRKNNRIYTVHLITSHHINNAMTLKFLHWKGEEKRTWIWICKYIYFLFLLKLTIWKYI